MFLAKWWILGYESLAEYSKRWAANCVWFERWSCFCKWHSNAHRTLHDTTRHDTTRQPPTRKSCNVRGSTTRRDTTRQKSGLVVSDLTMLDICDKARFLSCRVASCRRPPHITRFSCRGLSRRVASCNVRWALRMKYWTKISRY